MVLEAMPVGEIEPVPAPRAEPEPDSEPWSPAARSWDDDEDEAAGEAGDAAPGENEPERASP